jgi:hypothetical protein
MPLKHPVFFPGTLTNVSNVFVIINPCSKVTQLVKSVGMGRRADSG